MAAVSVELRSLYWPNMDPRIPEAQMAVFKHLGIPLQQDCIHMPHGAWIDKLMAESKADVVGVVDVDCIPLNAQISTELATWAYVNESLCGPAVTANRIDPNHVYVSPFFSFVSRKFWQRIQPLTALRNHRSDVMQEYTRAAEAFEHPFRLCMPVSYQIPNHPIPWRIGTDGAHYGCGTTYEGGIYHLFKSRMETRAELFLKQCAKVLGEKPATS